MPNGPFALLPLPNQNESCVIWTNSTVVSNKLTSLDDGLFNDIASEYTPKFYGRLHRISDVKLYNLQTHVATSRRKNKTFLLGGALFSMHPLAGQGFNLIARDIEFFTDKISQLSIDELCKYSTFTGRLPDNALMLSGVHCIASLFGNKSLAIKAARHVGMKMIDSFDLVKNATIMQAMGYGFA
jgi:2-octaprenyl-6-methoxyphenol hydroxylase